MRFTQCMDGLLGVAGIIKSDEMDHSRKFPTFRTSKKLDGQLLSKVLLIYNAVDGPFSD